MADPVRLAHIGVAYPHGDGYIETLLLMPGIELVALYDPDPAAARALLPPEFQGLGVYDDFDEVLRKERPEAVLITQPNDTTARFITQAAEAGVHVFAEKPCARTAAELMPAIEAVRKSGVRFSTGYTRRVSPAGIAIKEIIERGVLGSLVSIEASWVTTSVQSRGPDNPMFSAERNGGGILHWLGCHWLDFMRWSTSAEVSEVSAILDTLSGEQIDVEDTAAVSLRFDNGMIGSLHCTYAIDKMPHQLFFGCAAPTGGSGGTTWAARSRCAAPAPTGRPVLRRCCGLKRTTSAATRWETAWRCCGGSSSPSGRTGRRPCRPSTRSGYLRSSTPPTSPRGPGAGLPWPERKKSPLPRRERARVRVFFGQSARIIWKQCSSSPSYLQVPDPPSDQA